MQRTNKVQLGVVVAILLFVLGGLSVQAASPGDWAAARGVYIQADGNQYNSGELQLLPLDNGCVLFEFDVMAGSEDVDESVDYRLSGTMLVAEDGSATWEEEAEDGTISLSFALLGRTIKVTQKGDLPISLAGTYTWLEASLNATEGTARELLEGLPTVATSLNSNNGAYRLEMASEETDGWFYDVKALFQDNGVLLGEFLVARDLSAVYRIDTETPILLHGSADSMMAAVTPASIPLVDAAPSSSVLHVGETTRVVTVTPGRIPATIQCVSDHPGVVAVDAAGVITGVAPGSAVVSGTITVDGSQKAFRFNVEVRAR